MGIFDFFYKKFKTVKNDNGHNILFDEEGRLEGNKKDGKQEGLWKKYWKNGQLKLERNFKDGKREGLEKYYYENGQLGSEGNHKNGKAEGLWKSYHQNGKLEHEGNYKNNKQQGLWKYYDENGQLESEGNHKDDKQEGLWKYYDENGQLKEEMNWKNGVKKESKKVDYTSKNISSEPEMIDKDKKIIVEFEGIEIQTTLNIVEKNDYGYEENSFGNAIYSIYTGGDFRLNAALALEPTGFFTETCLHNFKSGSIIEFESNFKVSKEDQKKIHQYRESDDGFPYVSSWYCYFDKNENQTFDKEIIKKIKIDFEKYGDGSYSPNGLSLQRLDPSDIVKPLEYYHG